VVDSSAKVRKVIGFELEGFIRFCEGIPEIYTDGRIRWWGWATEASMRTSGGEKEPLQDVTLLSRFFGMKMAGGRLKDISLVAG